MIAGVQGLGGADGVCGSQALGEGEGLEAGPNGIARVVPNSMPRADSQRPSRMDGALQYPERAVVFARNDLELMVWRDHDRQGWLKIEVQRPGELSLLRCL